MLEFNKSFESMPLADLVLCCCVQQATDNISDPLNYRLSGMLLSQLAFISCEKCRVLSDFPGDTEIIFSLPLSLSPSLPPSLFLSSLRCMMHRLKECGWLITRSYLQFSPCSVLNIITLNNLFMHPSFACI